MISDHKPKPGQPDDEDEIAYITVRWKTRASFVYRTYFTSQNPPKSGREYNNNNNYTKISNAYIVEH